MRREKRVLSKCHHRINRIIIYEMIWLPNENNWTRDNTNSFTAAYSKFVKLNRALDGKSNAKMSESSFLVRFI